MTIPQDSLLTRLGRADVVCKDCGSKYGKYSVGCSSTWNGTCGVCGEDKPVTEVRDWGYLTKGIHAEKAKIREQSLEVSNYMKCQEDLSSKREELVAYMASVGPIMNDDELEECLTASYEQGDLTLKLTEEEVTALATLIDDVSDKYPPGQDVTFDSAFMKITELYEDYCVKYELSPALKAYHEKYGTFGVGEDQQRWEGFRDAFVMLNSK